MRRLRQRMVASCTILVLALHVGACSDPAGSVSEVGDESNEAADLRVTMPTPETTGRTNDALSAYNGPNLITRLDDRGKPQPQPWKGDDPLPKDPTPKGGGGTDQSGTPTGSK